MEKKIRATTSRILQRRTAEAHSREIAGYQFISQLLQESDAEPGAPSSANRQATEEDEVLVSSGSVMDEDVPMKEEPNFSLPVPERLVKRLLLSRAFELRGFGESGLLKRYVLHLLLTTRDAALALACSDFLHLHGSVIPIRDITEALRKFLSEIKSNLEPDEHFFPLINMELILGVILNSCGRRGNEFEGDRKELAVVLSNLVVDANVRESIVFKNLMNLLAQNIQAAGDSAEPLLADKNPMQVLELCRFIGRASNLSGIAFLKQGLEMVGKIKLPANPSTSLASNDSDRLTGQQACAILRCCQTLQEPATVTALMKMLILGMESIQMSSGDVARMKKELSSLQARSYGLPDSLNVIRFRAVCSQFRGILMVV